MKNKHAIRNYSLYISLITACILFFAFVVFNSANAHNDTLQTKLTDIVDQNSQNIPHISIYVYQFKNKHELSINSNYKYLPASLIKVPSMIAYYKMAQVDPTILTHTLVHPPQKLDLYSQNIHPSKTIQSEKPYTVDQLISDMIIYSDNEATDLLLTSTDIKRVYKVYTDLGIKSPDYTNIDDTISIEDCAKFFKVLYDESYLNDYFSQKALLLLTHADYKDGIVAGVPNSILVAHKFGERTIRGARKISQFHECGIVYDPKNPYLLCVMTDGNNIYAQSEVVKKVSQVIYQEIAKTY
jgi:beta-lactamase class A